MKIKFNNLRDWEKSLILRCHIAGKIKYDAELDSNDEFLDEDDGTIEWSEFKYGYESDNEYFPETKGFPEMWFKLYRGRQDSEWRELTMYAKRELAEQQAAIDEHTKRQETLHKETELLKTQINNVISHAEAATDLAIREIKTALRRLHTLKI